MAIYHLSVKTISRSAGRSATAAAAYRSASVIYDERTGLTHDYTRKQGVISASLITPDGAPGWASNRADLWNQAEAAENRKNSVTAREFVIALPAELSPGDRADLAWEFAAELSDRHQVAVDLALHAPGQEGDQRNHHAHLLLTTRQLGPEGFSKKTRELDNRQSGEVKRWRERWATLVNGKLEQAGLSVRVDHRSHKDRGIDQEPTVHLGPEATHIERRGEASHKGDLNRSIQEHNQRRRSSARELAEAEAEYKTAQRRSQQAREQAKRQQAPGPAPTHGSAAVDQDAQPVPAHLAAIVDALLSPSSPPVPGRVASDEVWGIARARHEQFEQEKREAEKRQQEEAERKHLQERAARDRALAGLAKFRRIVGERVTEIASKAAENAEAMQNSQRHVWQEQRELAEIKPRPPGMVARMLGGAARYRQDLEAWQSKAQELHDTEQRLRVGIEAERQEHAQAGETAARELARANPDLVLLAEKGQAIETKERQERRAEEAERERKAEEIRQQRERERSEVRRREKEEAKRRQAEYEAKWAERAVARLLTHVDDPRAQLRILEDNRRTWARQEPPGGPSRKEWREYGDVLDARIKSLRGGQVSQVDQKPDRERQDQAPRRRPRGPGM